MTTVANIHGTMTGDVLKAALEILLKHIHESEEYSYQILINELHEDTDIP